MLTVKGFLLAGFLLKKNHDNLEAHFSLGTFGGK